MSNDVCAYVEHGFALVPIPYGKKGPITRAWNLRMNTVTAAHKAALLTENVGIAHAYCHSCPTAAFDVDNAALATHWLEERDISLDQLLSANDAVQIVSGKENRAKLSLPLLLAQHAARTESIQIKDGAAGPVILEFRCAAAGRLTVQDVLPPSIHPDTGKPYKWGGKGDWRNLPEIPAKLMLIWQEELQDRVIKKRRHQSPLALAFKAVDDTPRQRARLVEMTGYISADCAYELYRDIVWAHLSLGWHDVEELAMKWCLAAPDRFDEANFAQVVASYDVSRTPTMGTITHFARLGGWNG